VRIGSELLRMDESLRRWDFGGERAVQTVLCELLRPGDVMLDIGANFGLHTLYAARLVGPQGRVYAFEPVPRNVELLTRNADLSGVANQVIVVEKAVSNSSEPFLEMHVPADAVAVTASLRPVSAKISSQRVGNIRLDDFAFDEEHPLRAVKIDVEGAELDVLRSGERLLRRERPVLLIEIHGYALPAFGASVEAVRDFLAALGYREQLLEMTQSRGADYFQSLYLS